MTFKIENRKKKGVLYSFMICQILLLYDYSWLKLSYTLVNIKIRNFFLQEITKRLQSCF